MSARRPRSLRRGLAFVVAVLACVGFLAGFTLALKRRDLAEGWLLARLRGAGLVSPSLRVGRMEWGILEVRELRAGGEALEVGQLTARFDLHSLMEGRLEELRVRDAELKGDLAELHSLLGALRSLVAGGSDRGPAWERLVVESARVRLDSVFGTVEASGSGRLARLGESGFEGEARAEATSGALRGRALLSAWGTSRALEGELELTLGGSGSFGWGSVSGANLSVQAAIRGRPDSLELVARKCADLRIDGLVWEGVVALAAPLHGCLSGPDQPFLAIGTDAAGERTLSASLEMPPAALGLELGDDAARAEGETPRLSVTAAGSLEQPRLTFSSRGGFARIAELGMEARGLGGSVEWTRAGGIEARLRLAEIVDVSGARRLPRLGLDLEARRKSSATSFALRLSDDSRSLALEVAGGAPGGGAPLRADLHLDPVSLGRDGVELLRLLPGFADAEASGTLAALGTLEWGPGGLRGHVDVALRELDLSSSPVHVGLANGVVRLEGLSPLAIPADQLLSAARLDFGLELLDGLARFGVSPEGSLTVEESDWTLAGGHAVASGSLDPTPQVPLVLVVEDADPGELFELLDLGALEGEGSLSGTITLARDEGGLVLTSTLRSDERGGWIRYRPEPEEPEQVRQALAPRAAALASFRYDELELELSGRVPGAVDVGVRLHGANPDLGGRSPVELRFDVPGALEPRPGLSLEEEVVPEAVEQRLAAFEARLASADRRARRSATGP